MIYNKFNKIKDELGILANEIFNITSEQIFLDRIVTAQNRLNNEKMNVLVVGEFSRGKSTFINAIIGKQVLPSSVNPTTATINVLEGNGLDNMVVNYIDGKTETINLPEDKVKKFLDSYVTVNNNDVDKIEKIKLNISGNLETWDCILVDTPGVNDLDEAREEITFKYLCEADACIVLLDAQQPLSESERRFIQSKVLTNDINRLLFVINRIDDIDENPNGENFNRIKEYVFKLIKENFPEIHEPNIFGVSSRETLKARHKNTENKWEEDFRSFEKHAINFVSSNATIGKIPQHIQRLNKILYDIENYLYEENKKLNCSDDELEYMFEKLKNEENILKINMKEIEMIIESEKVLLQKEISKVSKKEFEVLKVNLVNEANNVNSEEKFNNLKNNMSYGMRQVTEKLSKIIYDHREKLQNEFYSSLNKILKENNIETSLTTMSSKAINFDVKSSEELSYSVGQTYISSSSSSEISDSEAEVAVLSGICGLVGGVLFGGGIGIIAAIIGAGFFSGLIEDDNDVAEAKRKTVEMMKNIINQINNIVRNAEAKASEIAMKEINEISEEYMELLNNRILIIEKSLNRKQNDLERRKNNLEESINEVNEKIIKCKEIREKLNMIEREL